MPPWPSPPTPSRADHRRRRRHTRPPEGFPRSTALRAQRAALARAGGSRLCRGQRAVPQRTPRVAWVPESSATSLPTGAQLSERWTKHGTTAAARSGWIYQQLLKLGVPEYVPEISSAYMLVDADVIWLRPWTIAIDDDIRFPYTQAFESHPPYRDWLISALWCSAAGSVLADRSSDGVRPRAVVAMKQAIEASHGVAWWDAYVQAADPLEPSSISEMDIFGLWVLDNHPAAASHRQTAATSTCRSFPDRSVGPPTLATSIS